MFQDQTLLISGGTGSFGNAVLRRFLQSGLREIRIFSRDEKKQDDMRKRYAHPKLKFYLGDVRERDSLVPAMRGVNYVFHAAALKQVPSCEFHPMEAVKTNVLGTEHLVEAAIQAGVRRVICLSTDKAVYPINAMGMSKAMMEKVMVATSRNLDGTGTVICGTRYGNVMASRGSVIPLFQQQIRAGGPVTVTDRRMTRFFMSTREAVSLVLQAAAGAEDQGVLMLEMGQPVNILTLAERMILLCGHEVDDIGIEFTGTRPGESLVEELHGPGESIEPTAHPAIVAVLPVSLPPGTLDDAVRELADFVALRDHDGARDRLRSLTSTDAGAQPASATVERRTRPAASEALPRRT